MSPSPSIPALLLAMVRSLRARIADRVDQPFWDGAKGRNRLRKSVRVEQQAFEGGGGVWILLLPRGTALLNDVAPPTLGGIDPSILIVLIFGLYIDNVPSIKGLALTIAATLLLDRPVQHLFRRPPNGSTPPMEP